MKRGFHFRCQSIPCVCPEKSNLDKLGWITLTISGLYFGGHILWMIFKQ